MDTRAHTAGIITPRYDIWLAGGLSIVVLATLAAVGLLGSPQFLLQKFLVLTIILNGTHFMASYRLLYSSREFASRYPWASYYLPAILIAYSVVALAICRYNPAIAAPIDLLTAVATLYLALHYTGQVWGVVSSFAALEGIRFEPSERMYLRRFLRFMAVWHVAWGIQVLWPPSAEYAGYVHILNVTLNSLGILSLVGGLVCFRRTGKRLGRSVPLRVTTPYIALHIWYAFLYLFPQSIFWVQIFHAIQYLPFPLRVELNRAHSSGVKESSTARLTGSYFSVLALVSALIFGVVPWLVGSTEQEPNSAWVALAAIINIHHYFIDGCIWHISNPVVRDELFAHTRPVSG